MREVLNIMFCCHSMWWEVDKKLDFQYVYLKFKYKSCESFLQNLIQLSIQEENINKIELDIIEIITSLKCWGGRRFYSGHE